MLYPGTFTGSHIIILMTLAPCTRACEHHPSKHPWGQNRGKGHTKGVLGASTPSVLTRGAVLPHHPCPESFCRLRFLPVFV